MHSKKDFLNSARQSGARSGWHSPMRSFAVPDIFSIATPLAQCEFVMTQMAGDNKPFPVDMSGNPIDPKTYGTTDFYTAESLWRIGRGTYFDGYSLVLGENPEPVFEGNDYYYLVAGIYPDGLITEGKNRRMSNDVMADWMALNNPLIWHTPDRKGVCWAGLSPTPIIGGKNSTKHISSFNLTLPITCFALRENVIEYSKEDKDYLTVLPPDAEIIINKWF